MHFFEVDIASLQFATPSLSVLILTFDFFVLFYTQNTPEYTHPPLPTLPTILVETWEPFHYGFHSTRVMSKRLIDISSAFFFFFFFFPQSGGVRTQKTSRCPCLGPVFRKVDNVIYRINLYPLDNAIGNFPNTYPLKSDLSSGECNPTFEQPEPAGYTNYVDSNILL